MKIGIIIADADEFAPLYEKVKDRIAEEKAFLCGKEIRFTLPQSNPDTVCTAVFCGIGKVNAASAASHLADSGCDVMLSYGLSGGIQGIGRGEICICDRFLEHDFDLSGIGFKRCEKPGQDYIYQADPRLVECFKEIFPEAKVGTAVSGDTFVSDAVMRDFLKAEFHAMSCDMETAAIAYVCHYDGIPFVAVRRISDDAGESAAETYRAMNVDHQMHLHEAVLTCAGKLCKDGLV